MAAESQDGNPRADAGEFSLWEKVAHRSTQFLNDTNLGRAWQNVQLRGLSYAWVRQVIARRMLVEGLDELTALTPPQGVLFVANHRSFFDLYSLMLAICMGPVPWAEQMNFPVRSNFFYDHPLGLAVNYVCCGGAMYPPIYRQSSRRERNDAALDIIIEYLKQPGHVIGLHPEGTRNKSDDPYSFLPAQPGAGKMALLARPTVIPVFVTGLSNDFIADVKYNFRSEARRERPIIGMFGKPIDYSQFLVEKPRPTLYKRTADLFMTKIQELTVRERELRAQCLAGQIDDQDPRWIANRKGVSPWYAKRQ